MGTRSKLIVTDKALLNTAAKLIGPSMTDEDLDKLTLDIDKAVQVMIDDTSAVAVAANQIGSDLSFFVSRYDLVRHPHLSADSYPYLKKYVISIYLNPTYTKLYGASPYIVEEGCLSLPDESVKVSRWSAVTFKAAAMRITDGIDTFEYVERTLTGFSAQIAQHEIEHLEGKGLWGKYGDTH